MTELGDYVSDDPQSPHERIEIPADAIQRYTSDRPVTTGVTHQPPQELTEYVRSVTSDDRQSESTDSQVTLHPPYSPGIDASSLR